MTFWKKLSEKLSKADISPFVQLSTKLSISVEDFHKLSAISGNYRQSYRYRKLQENYRKFIVIEKNDLSPTPSYQWNHTLSQCRGLLGEPPSPLVNPAWRAESEPVDAFLCQPMLNIKCFPAFLYESVCISI